MSQVRKHIKTLILITLSALFAVNCARGSSKTQFAKNLEADAGKPAPTYEEWVALIGQNMTDDLYAGIGQDSLNTLNYGLGQSNLVQLINLVAAGSPTTASAKMIVLVGSDFVTGLGPGNRTGLGTIVTLNLIKSVETEMNTTLSTNLVGGGVVPTDQLTVDNLASLLNTLTLAEIQSKLIELFGFPASGGGFKMARNMSGANDALYVGRMAKIVAHVTPGASSCAAKLCPLLQGLPAIDITDKLAPLMSYNTGAGIPWANKLVETIESTTAIANLITVIAGVTIPNITAKMALIIDTVTDCTKMGYTINNVTTLATLISIINNVSASPGAARLGNTINKIEDAASWTAIQGTIAPGNWVGGQQTWGSPVKAAPWGTAGSGGTISVTIAGGIATGFSGVTAGTNYHTDLAYTNVFAGCTTQPILHLTIVAGQITGGTVANPGVACTNGSFPLTLSDPITTTGMARLVSLINNVTPANYFQILNLVEGISSIDKLVVLVQDGKLTMDLVQMMNGMTPVGTGAGCNGVITVTGGVGVTTQATAAGFVSAVPVAGSLNYITVLTPGTYAGTLAGRPTTVTDGGCGVLAASTIVMNTAQTQVTGIYLNALPVNSMAELVENIGITALTRLREVIDGERLFNNIGTQTSGAPAAPPASTYLGKMVTLISNLSQAQEGPIKVTQLVNGVTNTDKIIDLIYDVTVTTNLSTIINGIFSASINPAVGCTNALPPADFASNVLCDNNNGTSVAGNGYVWGDRSHAVDMLVYTLQNISSSANLVAVINGSTPSKVSDLINHVSTGTTNQDSANANCGACTGAAAVTSVSNAGGAKLVNLMDHAGLNAYDLAFTLNKVASTIKMAKLINFSPIGQTAAGLPLGAPTNFGTGKIGDLLVRITSTPAAVAGVASTGNCFSNLNGVISVNLTSGGSGYTSAPTVTFPAGAGVVAVATISPAGVITGINITDPGTGYAALAAATITPALGGAAATANVGSCSTTRGLAQTTGTGPLSNIGKGKLVNMVNYISGASDTAAMTQLANLMDGVTSAQKLGDLINKVQRSSNVVALVNAIIDPLNNTSTADLIALMNLLPVAEIHKLTGLIQQLNPAIETATDTLAGADQALVAQLMAPYATQTVASLATVTISNANPAVVTWAAHGLTAGREVVFSTVNTLPSQLNANQVYYVLAPLAGSFNIAATPGGAAISTLAGGGVGNHTGISSEPSAISGVGYVRMSELLGSLVMTNGTTGYAAAPGITVTGCGAAAATATVGTQQVTRVAGVTGGSCTSGSIVPTITAAATTAQLGVVAMPTVSHGAPSGANGDVAMKSIYLKDGGAGAAYAFGSPVTIGYSTCGLGTLPTATAFTNGLTSIDVTNPGSCTTPPTIGGFGAGGASAVGIIAGTLNTAAFTNLYGGTNYTNGQVCPVQGAGGSGATVTVTSGSPGPITAVAIAAAGSDYISGQTVTIGGAARAYANVSAAGAIATGAGQIVVNYSGCGYTAATATVTGCTVNPTLGVPVVAAGQVTTIGVTVAGSGCPRNPNVIITGAHGDGATATVGTLATGSLIGISMSNGSDNLANVLANTEKAPITGSIAYGNAMISAREAMVRLLNHGVTYNGGIFPGVGPAHLAYNVMSVLTSGASVGMVITMMNNDTTSLADLDLLIGCGDGVEFGIIAPVTSNDFETICRANAVWP